MSNTSTGPRSSKRPIKRQQLGGALKRKFVIRRITCQQCVAAAQDHRGAGELQWNQGQLRDVRGGLTLAIAARLFDREIQDCLNDGVIGERHRTTLDELPVSRKTPSEREL